jgi:hypothetical protein
MTLSDYLLNGTLVALVLLQIRGRRLHWHTLVLPVALVLYVGHQYLHAFPTAGNDLWLTLGGPALGLVLGLGSGLFTTIKRGTDGVLVAKAGVIAAGLWILGTGSRLAFEIYATHGGQGAIGRFRGAQPHRRPRLAGLRAPAACGGSEPVLAGRLGHHGSP